MARNAELPVMEVGFVLGVLAPVVLMVFTKNFELAMTIYEIEIGLLFLAVLTSGERRP